MNCLIFGANSETGREIVRQSLAKGHEVTAFVPNLDVFKPHEKLMLIKGNVLDSDEVDNAIAFQAYDVVFSALGDTRTGKNKVCSMGIYHIIRSMQTYQLNRLIVTSSMGVAPEYLNFTSRLYINAVLGGVHKDLSLMELYIAESGLDWTIVRPLHLTGSPARGEYRVMSCPPDKPLRKISRADVAHFMLNTMEAGQHIGAMPAIGY